MNVDALLLCVMCMIWGEKKPLNIKFKDGNPSIKSTKQMRAQI
jgi:hypothetical protein